MNLDANLLGPEYARLAGTTDDKKDRDVKLDQANPSRQMLPDEEEKQQMHNKLLYAFKEFICKTLDPFFDSQGLEFIDPDEDVILSSSDESDFEYNLPSGYNSQDSDNPEYIPVMGSGSESSSSDGAEMPNFDELSNSIMR